MGVRMDQPIVLMRMGVLAFFPQFFGSMLMDMVFARVVVGVGVFQRFMDMLMLMVFGWRQPGAYQHDRHSRPE